MPLPIDFIERLKAANPIAEVMGSYVTLKRTGRDYVCLCPFHNEKTPSCHIHPDKEYFHCFGCGAGGDVITFTMKYNNLDYWEAVKLLAERDGILKHTNMIADTKEGYVVRFADVIAYINHDIDDSVRAGIMTEEDIPKNITKVLGGSKSERITTLVTSLIKGGAESLHMDDEVSDAYTALHRFMFDFVYTNPKCKSEEVKAKDMIAKLYDYYVHHIEKLPAFYMNLAYQFGIDRAICDYISGMTDGFAIETFKNLFIPLGWTKY